MRRLTAAIPSLLAFARREAVLIAAALVFVLAALTFAEMLDEVLEGEPDEIDVAVFGWLRSGPDPSVPIGPDWLITTALDVTALGSAAVLALVVAAVAGYLALVRNFRDMWLVLGASVLGAALSNTLKAIVGRERPDQALHLAEVTSASFPSGHSMLSAVTYLTLGAILATTRKRRREKTYILCTALLLTALVGVSRVYIGVHWPTDVLAGWSVGLCWALLCLVAAYALDRRAAARHPGTQPSDSAHPRAGHKAP